MCQGNKLCLFIKEVDLVTTITVTYPRSKVIDFSVQFSDDPVSLLIPYPEMDNTAINGIIRPFHSQAGLLFKV